MEELFYFFVQLLSTCSLRVECLRYYDAFLEMIGLTLEKIYIITLHYIINGSGLVLYIL